MAFQLLEFSEETSDTYIDFCIKEVYGNYPATMYEVAKNYEPVVNRKQVYLAEMIIEMHERLLNERKLSYEIRDLQISKEHQHIFRRAMMEQDQIINKMANKKSVLVQLFNTRTLKYGIRNAYVSIGGKDENFYQVNPYMQHGYQVEMPAAYVNDPVNYELERRAFFEEVIQNEVGYKGLSASTEGER